MRPLFVFDAVIMFVNANYLFLGISSKLGNIFVDDKLNFTRCILNEPFFY